MRKQLLPAIVAFVAFTLLCGVVYPLVVTGIAQVTLAGPADGSLVERPDPPSSPPDHRKS